MSLHASVALHTPTSSNAAAVCVCVLQQSLLCCIDNVILSMSFKSDFNATNDFITIWVDAYFGCASTAIDSRSTMNYTRPQSTIKLSQFFI